MVSAFLVRKRSFLRASLLDCLPVNLARLDRKVNDNDNGHDNQGIADRTGEKAHLFIYTCTSLQHNAVWQ